MANSISSRVISLLAQWEERKEAGEALSPEELCKNSPELLNQVKAQLELLNDFPNHSESTGDFDPDLTTDDQPVKATFKDLTGTIIANRYRLTKLVGEGGMGSVWQAEQSQPVKRQVALKLIRNTTKTSAQVIRRFEAERQALALMDHPGIARIYDGGVTEWKDPYFVMELVPGVPLTEYCDSKRLSVKQRLKLFVSICQAVQHAHQKGIIHRDLKPGNILVAEVDGNPVPKVIDFGVAKATEQKLTEETINDFGAVVGTLAYMSPEQADAGTVDIDTRTDVYALGVILFELLAGSTPLDTKQYKKMALRELLRLINDVEPPRLSAKLSSAENLPNLAATRSTEPAQLTKAVQGDLEWIVLKALEKDRTRRYETATGFAADVQRHLAGEAVQAHPPSRWYLMKKFVKRNRVQVVAAGLVVVALLAGLVLATFGLVEAWYQEKKAVAAADKEREAKDLAETRRKEAEINLKYAKKGNELLGSVFAGLDPKKIAESGRPLQDVLKDNLVKAVKELEESAIGDPLEVAEMQYTLGESLLGLGETKIAGEEFEKARWTFKTRLGSDHPATIRSIVSLGKTFHEDGQPERALPLFEESLKICKVQLGPEHKYTLTSMIEIAGCYHDLGRSTEALQQYQEALKISNSTLGSDSEYTLTIMNAIAGCFDSVGLLKDALPVYEEVLKLRKAKNGMNHPDTLISMINLAGAYRDNANLDIAIPMYEQALSLTKANLGPDHPLTLKNRGNLAKAYEEVGSFDRALLLNEETLKICKVKLGYDHPDTLACMNNLASCYHETKQFDRALPLFEETLKLCKSRHGLDHPRTLACMNNMGLAYKDAGKVDHALLLYNEAFKIQKAKLGADHPDTLISMSNLASGYRAAGKLSLAIPLLEEMLKITKSKNGPDHPDSLSCMNDLALNYRATGKIDLALLLLEEMLNLTKAKLGPEHSDTLSCMNELAVIYRDAGRIELALNMLEKTFLLRKTRHGIDHPDTLSTMGNLCKAYCELKQGGKAKQLLSDLVNSMRKQLENDKSHFAGLLTDLSHSLLSCGEFASAELLLRESLSIRETMEIDTWSTFNTMSMLGLVLLERKSFLDAERYLMMGYQGMKVREKTIPRQVITRLSEAIDRLIQLYTEINKPDEVKKWQKEKKRLTEQSPVKKE